MIPPNDRNLTTKEVARLTRLSPAFFEKARGQGRGPAYFKVGARVIYRLSDVERWIEEGRRTPGRGPFRRRRGSGGYIIIDAERLRGPVEAVAARILKLVSHNDTKVIGHERYAAE